VSAQGIEPCHAAKTGAGCLCDHDQQSDQEDTELYAFSGKAQSDDIVRSRDGEMLVDSGCNLSFFPPDPFQKYVVSVGKRPVRIQLGGKDSEIVAKGKCVVHLPLKAEDGTIRIAKEECVLSDKCRCPLFGAMCRDLHISKSGSSSVEVDGLQGRFRAVIERKADNTPVLKVQNPGVTTYGVQKRQCAVAVADSTGGGTEGGSSQRAALLQCATNKDLERLQSHREEAKGWPVERRQAVLLALHRRFAHATCRKLYLTLVEHGLGGVYTEKECRAVGCDVCALVNARKVKVPRVSDVLRSTFAVREVAYQDLLQLPNL
jgi:hypothetical protein